MIVRTCIALWDYHPVTATSISIVEGEQLVVLNDDDAHWIKVRRMDGIEGYVPRNYTQLQTAAARGNDRHILPASPRSPSPTLLSPKIPGYDQKSNSGDELSDDYDKRRKKKEKKRDNKGTVKRPVKWTRQNSEQSLHIIEAIANAAAESAEPEMMNLEGELNGGNPEISNPVLVNKTKDPRVLVADAKSGKAEKEKRGILGSKTDREKSKEKEREKEKEKEKDREDRETASKKLKRHTVKIPTMVRGSMKDKDRDVEISMPQFKEEGTAASQATRQRKRSHRAQPGSASASVSHCKAAVEGWRAEADGADQIGGAAHFSQEGGRGTKAATSDSQSGPSSSPPPPT